LYCIALFADFWGCIRTVEVAEEEVELCDALPGKNWTNPEEIRLEKPI
jgi:hypothetical protein